MKKLIILLIIANSICGYCQDKMINIEYEIFYNTDLPNTQYANLYINKFSEESIYIKKSKSKNKITWA